MESKGIRSDLLFAIWCVLAEHNQAKPSRVVLHFSQHFSPNIYARHSHSHQRSNKTVLWCIQNRINEILCRSIPETMTSTTTTTTTTASCNSVLRLPFLPSMSITMRYIIRCVFFPLSSSLLLLFVFHLCSISAFLCHIVRLFVLFCVGISIRFWLFCRPLECSLLTSLGKLCRRNNFIFIWSLILACTQCATFIWQRQRATQQANLP